jgi:hypothetical protein
MDEYGYSGLDQVINEDDEIEEIEDDENDFGPEDEEDVMNESDSGIVGNVVREVLFK